MNKNRSEMQVSNKGSGSMTIDKAKLDSLLGEAYTWFTAFDEIIMRRPVQLLVQQMQKAIDRKDYTEAWFFLHQLNALTEKIRGNLSTEPREQSFIILECALAAYRMGNLWEALKLLEMTLNLYDRKYGRHYEATVTWILGCIQWQTPDQRSHAILSWENSIRIFQDLVQKSLDFANVTRSTWYSNRVAEMNSVLELALQPVEPVSTSPPSPPPASHQTDTSEMPSAVMSSGDFLRLFRVRNEVSAGDFRSTRLNSASFGYVEINQFQIDGRAHSLFNLRRSGKVIKAVPGKEYDVALVKGESMTAEGIDDGDYILLCIQEMAEHNDIVAAQIHSVDTEATLKKFLIEKNKLILRFRSNNPIHKDPTGRDKEFQFNGYNHEEFQIVGVAIAVFKPLNVTS